MYDVIIIGAGPAGLFAAYEFLGKKVLVVDKGKDVEKRICPKCKKHPECLKCTHCSIMSGVGGAGLFSDGKLNLEARHGKTNLYDYISKVEAAHLIEKIDNTLIEFGIDKKCYNENLTATKKLQKKVQKKGMDLLLVKQKHIGSDNLPIVIGKMMKVLRKNKVEFKLNTEVNEILVKGKKYTGIKLKNGKEIKSKFLISAPGRIGASWMQKEALRIGMSLKHRGIEIGVRVECKSEIMDPITKIMWDPPIFITNPKTGDTTRTFCTNPNGFVVEESYHGFNCVNGYARKDKKSKNTNFALLADIELTHPAEDTIAYGKEIGMLSNTIGGGKPFCQRLSDLKNQKRSYWKRIKKSKVKPTLKDITPGDLSLALPGRIVNDLIDALKQLDKIVPGINDDTLLYGPELKFFSVKINTNKKLETNIKNLFVAGDGCGVAGNIIGAAATGVIAAQNVKKKLK